MTSTRLLGALLAVPFIASVGCKPKQASSERATASATASAASAAPERAKLRPVTATDVKVVRCNLPAIDPVKWTTSKWNNVAATRHLHLAGDGSLYFFPDFLPPVKLVATNDGCGYRLEGPLPDKKDAQYGLETDATIAEHPNSDDSKKTKCRVKALGEQRYGKGRLFGTRFIYPDHDSLMEMDLASDDCEPKDVKFPDVPSNLSGSPHVSTSGGDLLIAIGRGDWKYNKEIFRIDRSGKLVGRVGTADGKTAIDGGDVEACGDGYCTTTGWSWLQIHDKTGAKISTLKMGELTSLESPMIEGVVEVAGKGVFVLVGYQPKKQIGRAELVRLDGVD